MAEFWMKTKSTSKVSKSISNFELYRRVSTILFLDSVLVWVDVANNSYQWVRDPKGNVELNSWINASEKFNDAMQKGDEDESFKRLHQADDSFAGLAIHIGKDDLAQYYKQVYKEFGDLLKTKDLQKINDYMVQAYPQFKQKLGCPNSDNVVSACGQ